MALKVAPQRFAFRAALGFAVLLSFSTAQAQSANAVAPAGHDASAEGATEQILIGLSKQLLAAQRAFDQPALDSLLAPDYIEVSPVGEVDHRAEVLGFYSSEAKAKALPEGAVAPSLSLDETIVRVHGDHAVLLARETVSMAGHSVTMRVGFHFRKLDGNWKLYSTQYTPVRTKPAAR